MLFYKIKLYQKSQNKKDEEDHRRLMSRDDMEISEKCEDFSKELMEKGYFFLSFVREKTLTWYFGLALRDKMDIAKLLKRFISDEEFHLNRYRIEEITFKQFQELLGRASNCGYVEDEGAFYDKFGLSLLTNRSWRGFRVIYDEGVLSERTKEVIYSESERFFAREDFDAELDRIFSSEKKACFVGQPVDYLIESDDPPTREGVSRLLMEALYNNNRIQNKRFSILNVNSDDCFDEKGIKALFDSSFGGTVVIKAPITDNEEQELADSEYENLVKVSKVAHQYQRNVLSVFCLPRVCKNIKKKIYANMPGCTFVEIKEDLAYYDRAVNYLKTKAAKNKVRCDKKLFNSLEEKVGYLTPELNAIFDEWYSKKLKTSVFKQYKDFESASYSIVKEKPKGNAYDELNSMIGLESAKKVINQALDNYKALKLFKDRGIVENVSSRHMIFTGNPGTAKTTVARLFARIMRENGLLEKGQIVEVGRGDLVGNYVGWTATIVKSKFEEAKGGILFIDEAYSLVDDRNGLFGDEAINTIVQEMENKRDDVIVIFAGYPDKMEEFLKKNPGLRSRIAHHIHFEDYNPSELCEIADLIAKQKGVKLDADAKIKIKEIMERAVKVEDFGNGRFVRNVIEKAKMAQNSRLVHMDIEKLTKEDIKRICSSDIDMPEMKTKETRKIGFVV